MMGNWYGALPGTSCTAPRPSRPIGGGGLKRFISIGILLQIIANCDVVGPPIIKLHTEQMDADPGPEMCRVPDRPMGYFNNRNPALIRAAVVNSNHCLDHWGCPMDDDARKALTTAVSLEFQTNSGRPRHRRRAGRRRWTLMSLANGIPTIHESPLHDPADWCN
uniref:Uncharacterized protein n=1 Tax=Anopheles atroparvus TaxID=41427 RepID=A0A182JF97_ANOAO